MKLLVIDTWPWTTKPVLSPWGIFVAIAKNSEWVKIIDFFYSKNHKIMFHEYILYISYCKYININWLVICTAKSFMWTNLKAIFLNDWI